MRSCNNYLQRGTLLSGRINVLNGCMSFLLSLCCYAHLGETSQTWHNAALRCYLFIKTLTPLHPLKLGKETASFFQESGTHTKSTLNLNWADVWVAVPLCQRGFLLKAEPCMLLSQIAGGLQSGRHKFSWPSIVIKESCKWPSGAVHLSNILYWRKGTFELFTKCLVPANGYSIPSL